MTDREAIRERWEKAKGWNANTVARHAPEDIAFLLSALDEAERERDAWKRSFEDVVAREEWVAAEARLEEATALLRTLQLHHAMYCKWPHPSECEADTRARALLASLPTGGTDG